MVSGYLVLTIYVLYYTLVLTDSYLLVWFFELNHNLNNLNNFLKSFKKTI